MSTGNKIAIKDFNFYYGSLQALQMINLDIRANEIFALLGPARSGKTTFLKSLNRLTDLVYGASHTGTILLDGEDIYDPKISLTQLRRRVGIVFDLPIPLPMSIYENVAYGPKLSNKTQKKYLDEIIEKALRSAFLWDEVKDRLHTSALRLSGGQQQRLCISRILALDPEVLLLDEPCSGLDPISTASIEETLSRLKKEYTIVLVPHNIQQASRVADRVGFLLDGKLVEEGPAFEIFTRPKNKKTEDYISGKFG
ncbi:MAG: phosphate ABC transporter ATP-binding protein [Proteobacteria bacterium]|nr:phosphate ABC transporter ATP-binding protein [Pseudomonadota bacterium]MBU2260853.1 phosphate ABC transporter ATP-binding protein [Pseudomonadota bacterium]